MSYTYRESGVDIEQGNLASRIAYQFAKKTFGNRRGKFGEPKNLEMGFSGLMDCGDFYLCFNSDGVGSKAQVAHYINQHHTLGYDLVAMVADDAVCVGAEPFAMVDTLDMEKVDSQVVEPLMAGLEKAAGEAGVAVVGGEIAELRDLIRSYHWSASLIGVVRKEKLMDGSRIRSGDALVGLLTDNFRSNGFSLIRKVLEENLGPWWHRDHYDAKITWGEKVLSPSKIFTPFVLRLIGRLDEPPRTQIHGIAHITGGGLRHNVERILPKGRTLNFHSLPPAPEVMTRIKEMGKVSRQEAYEVWNMGIAMVLITPEPESVLQHAKESGIQAQVIGEIQ